MDLEDVEDLFLRDAWLTIGSMGYVYDNSLWGPVGPVDGQRVNLTVSSVMNVSQGTLESTDLLVDAHGAYTAENVYCSGVTAWYGMPSG